MAASVIPAESDVPSPSPSFDRDFWENRLEAGTEVPVKDFARDDYMEKWVEALSPRCRAVLVENFGIEDGLGLKEVRAAILDERASLLPFLLVDTAAQGKRTYAIVEVAKARLAPAVVAACQTGSGEVEKYDRRALMWLLYLDDPKNLELVFHLDRTQRKGFARMVLPEPPDGNGTDPAAFFSTATIQEVLDAYEKEKDNIRQSYCAAVLPDGDGHYRVFIKRDDKPSFVSHGVENTFGFEREWIILVFDADLRRVRMCSESPDVPLILANRIGEKFFGEAVNYENEVVETSADVVEAFLKTLVAEPDKLPLVEVVVKNSGLEGGPQLRLSDEDNVSLSTALQQFATAFGDPLALVQDIESIKVHAFKKRVKMIFEAVDGTGATFEVRYADQPLNSKERREFEDRIKADYGITVLSTEKRYADE